MSFTFPELQDFSDLSFLVTGGAGFIGSHVCDYLVACKARKIIIIDNLSTGDLKNIQHLDGVHTIEFMNGDIKSFDDCLKATLNTDVVIHLAALGSVPRSVENPVATHEANSTGFVNILWAANKNKVSRFIFASSSSVYGDNLNSPKVEGFEGEPLSPYAITKKNNEIYAQLFSNLYGVKTIGLRFFNIFGPRQNVNGPYAAFLPLVITSAKNKLPIKINGDGLQSRDFTFVANAVWAISCAIRSNDNASGKCYNIGCGHSWSLLEVIKYVNEISEYNLETVFQEESRGDVKNSLADISRAALLLGYKPIYSIQEGIKFTFKEV